jgi:hypothetical protein
MENEKYIISYQGFCENRQNSSKELTYLKLYEEFSSEGQTQVKNFTADQILALSGEAGAEIAESDVNDEFLTAKTGELEHLLGSDKCLKFVTDPKTGMPRVKIVNK